MNSTLDAAQNSVLNPTHTPTNNPSPNPTQTPAPSPSQNPRLAALTIQARLAALLPADALLLGEQHDNPDHQRIAREVVQALLASGQLAAVVIEMAAQGNSSAHLAASATEDAVKNALNWDDKAWPWSVYAGPILAAVRAGVPVVGANLPRAQLRAAMADSTLDQRLNADALKRQNQLIREGHCDLLPESQITPMTRVQIARDVAMAGVISEEVKKAATHAVAKMVDGAANGAVAGTVGGTQGGVVTAAEPRPKTVLLIAGSGHVDTALAVPRHLPPGVTSRSVLLSANRPGSAATKADGFDAVWPTGATPDKDYCAQLKKNLGQ